MNDNLKLFLISWFISGFIGSLYITYYNIKYKHIDATIGQIIINLFMGLTGYILFIVSVVIFYFNIKDIVIFKSN